MYKLYKRLLCIIGSQMLSLYHSFLRRQLGKIVRYRNICENNKEINWWGWLDTVDWWIGEWFFWEWEQGAPVGLFGSIGNEWVAIGHRRGGGVWGWRAANVLCGLCGWQVYALRFFKIRKPRWKCMSFGPSLTNNIMQVFSLFNKMNRGGCCSTFFFYLGVNRCTEDGDSTHQDGVESIYFILYSI